MAAPDNKLHEHADYEIYIMRHGIAAKRGSPNFLDDSKRPLTSEGRIKMERIAKGLKRLGLELDWVVTSPLTRATETAQIVAETLAAKAPLDLCNELRPGANVEKLISFLATQPERQRILLVGHEPDLSVLAGRLIGTGHDANLSIKKGGCCLVVFNGPLMKSQGQLVWWLTPRLLRAMA